MTASLRGSQNADIELRYGEVPEANITNSGEDLELSGFTLMKKWAIQSSNSSGSEDASDPWIVSRAGYFTFLIFDKEKTTAENLNMTLEFRFQTLWEAEAR